MSKLYVDLRWSGDHGIGRMAREIFSRISCNKLQISGSPSSPLDPIRMAIGMLKIPYDSLVLTPGYNPPILFPRKYIITIPDLNYLDRKENSSFFKRIYFNTLVKRACKRALFVITISEFSKERILNWVEIPDEKVINIGCGVSDVFFNNSIEPWCPGFEYFLCVGNRKKHKNEISAIRAFAKAKLDNSVKLVFTGDISKPLEAEISNNHLDDKVIFLGRVDDAYLASLYKGARALLFPSLYEGFGLPVAEAMACGSLVITSNLASLPEVGRDAVIYVNPTSVDDIAGALVSVYQNEWNSREMTDKGIEYAKMYSWDIVSSKLEHALNEVL